jgi:hypothetical protein
MYLLGRRVREAPFIQTVFLPRLSYSPVTFPIPRIASWESFSAGFPSFVSNPGLDMFDHDQKQGTDKLDPCDHITRPGRDLTNLPIFSDHLIEVF